jgi:hypothetical protein
MSAIDFRTSLVRKPDPKGDRVVITLDGKVSLTPFLRNTYMADNSSSPTLPQRFGTRSKCEKS